MTTPDRSLDDDVSDTVEETSTKPQVKPLSIHSQDVVQTKNGVTHKSHHELVNYGSYKKQAYHVHQLKPKQAKDPNLSHLTNLTLSSDLDTQQLNQQLFWADIRWFLFWVGLGALFGWYFQALAWGIAGALCLYYVWRLSAVQRFSQWLNASIQTPPPEFLGSLSFVAEQLYQHRNQQQSMLNEMLGSIKRIRGSLLAMHDAVILLDEEDRLAWWNQSAETLLFLTADHRGQSVFDVIDVAEFHHYYQTASMPNDGIRLPSWHDVERTFQCELTRFGEEKLLIISDVTRLQHLEQIRKDFVGNVSHELRTPLTVLMGYIETFSTQPDLDPKWQRGFHLMTQQATRMYHIINDLLMLSRLENQEVPEPTCVDMPRLLSQLFDDAQMYNKDYGHLIELHLDSQKKLMGVETYLSSALSNLIINAVKYTPKGGNICITWIEVKEGLQFSVSDNGLGIAPEHIDRLTERFYRVDSGRSRATGGTGLGLAIVKHVLYQHDGVLQIDSTVGKGSTFTVLFKKSRVCECD